MALDRHSAPFRGADAVRAGDVTRDRLRGPTYERVGHDLYVGSANDLGSPRLRAAALHEWSRGHGVVAGPLAARCHGVDCPWDDAEIVLRGGRRAAPLRARVRTDRLAPHEVVLRDGVLMTSPARTAFDLARRSPLVEAVAAVDALAHRHRFGTAALRAAIEEHPGVRGLEQAARVVELMNPLAESLMESRVRVGLVLRGVPAPECQLELTLRGYGVVRLDMAWRRPPARRRPFALEYDGPEHRTITGQNRDNRRDAALDRFGWDALHVSSEQVLGTGIDGLTARVRLRLE